MGSELAQTTSVQPVANIGRIKSFELALFRGLRPRLHPWITVTPQPEGGAEFYEFMLSTRFHLNPIAYEIVEHMRAGDQTLGQIAAKLAAQFNENERKVMLDVVQVYKKLERRDATVHPLWRYPSLYVWHIRGDIQEFVDMIIRMLARGF